MKTISASFEIVTPMFLGGSDPNTPQGLRPSSVKGALRFWWRALNWSRHAGNGSEIDALKALHAEESHLFGHSASDEGGGQGVFLLQVVDHTKAPMDQPFGPNFGPGILYLLGMGLGNFQGGNHCTRKAIKEGQFELKLIFRPGVKDSDVAAVLQAVQAFGLLGALGSRARHGMGSVALTHLASQGLNLPAWQVPVTLQDYQKCLKDLLAAARQTPDDPLPPLSAFSQGARIDCSMAEAKADQLLDRLGREQQAHRSHGQQGRVNGQSSEYRFVPDHDLILEVAKGRRTVPAAPVRAVFGLPHNYYYSSLRGTGKESVEINFLQDDQDARRASPLLLHIHRLGNSFIGMHTLLKASFLPGVQPQVRLKPRGRAPFTAPVNVNWQVLHDYLDRFKKNDEWSKL